jgi:uncharacterized protein (TIGR02145 family)
MKQKNTIILFLLLIILSLISCDKKKNDTPPPPDTGTVTDVDGNVYKTIRIGTQVWMAENLKTTKYRNGAPITFINSDATWASLALPQSPAYCNSKDDTSTIANYGRLYNWNAATDSRGLAPAGWHVPSLDEWLTLMNFLGGKPVAGGKMKDTGLLHWPYQNIAATNSSGFTARFIQRREYNGAFRTPSVNFENYTYWWTSTFADNISYPKAYYAFVNNKGAPAYTNADYQNLGLSVRCVKD